MESTRRVRILLNVTWFVIFGTLAFQGRFMALFLRDRGFSDSEIGWILSLRPLACTAAAPVVSFVVDSVADTRYVYAALIPISVIFVNGYQVISSAVNSPRGRFAGYMMIYAAWSASFSPINSVFDAETVIRLRSIRAPSSEYGHSRLWGAVSWGVINAAIIGPFIDLTGSTWFLVYGFTVSAILTLAVLVCAERPPSHVDQGGDAVEMTRSSSLKYEALQKIDEENDDDDDDNDDEEVVVVLDRVEADTFRPSLKTRLIKISRLFVDSDTNSVCWTTVVFFVLVCAMSVGTTLVEGLVFLYFSEDLNASSTMCGVSVLVTVVMEIPLFYFSDTVILHTNVHVLNIIAALAYCIRVIVYTLLPSPWYVLLVEPLHGVTFACHKLACIEYISTISERAPGLETTAQGLRSAMQSIGAFLGSALGGLIMDRYGSNAMYRSAACVVFATCVLYATRVFYFSPSRSSRHEHPIPSPSE